MENKNQQSYRLRLLHILYFTSEVCFFIKVKVDSFLESTHQNF